ncbi:MAG: ABC transporter permease subunit [Rubrobacteraceae bacterium]
MRRERRTAYWMAAPALISVLAIVVYPLTFATYYSLRDVRPNLVGGFVGLSNYARAVNDPGFIGALSTTLLFTAASAGLSFLAGLGLALVLSRPFAGRAAVAAAVFLPWVFPMVVTAAFGRLALEDGGPVQSFLGYLGLWNGGPLLGNSGALLFSSVLVDAWRSTPFVALLLLAGMRTIPKDIYEAASVEGADSLQKFFQITLPLLRPTIMIVLLIRLLDAFRVQDLFLVMGGQQLESLSIYVYQNVLLSQINFGLGSAAAVFVFACALSLALLFTVVLKAQLPTGLGRSGIQNVMDEAAGRVYVRQSFPTTTVGALLTVLFLAPLAWVFWVSVTPSPGASGGSSGGSATSLSLVLYPLILSNGNILAGLANSGVIVTLTTLFTLLLACPAAYAIARLGFRHGNGLLSVMLAAAFFPPAAVLVPMLVQLRELGVIGTQLGAIFPDIVFFTPFAVWLLATFFQELPVEIEDAARVDGAGRLQVLTQMILPLAAPAMFATGAFVFVLSWNEFVFASTFTFGASRPITVVLADFVASLGFGVPAAPLAAASLIATLPPMLLFLAFRRRILSGLTGDAFARSWKVR